MKTGRAFNGLLASTIFAGILAVTYAPRAEAYDYTETVCQLNQCIVYGYIRTTDQYGNFTGYARYEISRYWRTGDAAIDP